jgi:hypothetical protein
VKPYCPEPATAATTHRAGSSATGSGKRDGERGRVMPWDQMLQALMDLEVDPNWLWLRIRSRYIGVASAETEAAAACKASCCCDRPRFGGNRRT